MSQSEPTIIVGDPISTGPSLTTSQSGKTTIVGNPVFTTSSASPSRTRTSTTYDELLPSSATTPYTSYNTIVGYFPESGTSKAISCTSYYDGLVYTPTWTTTGGAKKVGCCPVGGTCQVYFKSACLPPESGYLAANKPETLQCVYGTSQYCNVFSFSSPEAEFYWCHTIASQTVTDYLWPSQWSALYARTVEGATSGPFSLGVTATTPAEPSADVQSAPQTSSTVASESNSQMDMDMPSTALVAGVSIGAVLGSMLCIAAMFILWKCKKSGWRFRENPQSFKGVHYNYDGKEARGVIHESGGSKNVQELDGTTLASPRSPATNSWRAPLADQHSQLGPIARQDVTRIELG